MCLTNEIIQFEAKKTEPFRRPECSIRVFPILYWNQSNVTEGYFKFFCVSHSQLIL